MKVSRHISSGWISHDDASRYAEAILETVRAPLLVLDERLAVVGANPAFCATYDLEGEALLGRSIFEIGAGQWDTPELHALLERVLPDGSEIRDLAVSVSAGGLARREMVVNAMKVRGTGESRSLILLSVEDVTERERLRRRAERYTQRLERSNRDLQDFAHAASHDLQEPLRKIRIYVDRVTAALDVAALDERTQRYLVRLPEAAERMQTRIDDLLQLARVGRGEPSRQTTDLGAIVESVLDDLEVPINESGAQVEVDALPVLQADPAQMRILFQNLLSNALKFRREGTTPVVHIRAGTVADPDGLATTLHRIVVEDNGIGFEPQYAERIFGAFQRLHGREEYPGSGVGLAICQRIVEQHHGGITADGRPGEGARFTLTLPVTPPADEDAQ